MNLKTTSKYKNLIKEIGCLLYKGREQVSQSVNSILAQTYWLIGQHIVEFEQDGKEKYDYGSNLLDNLSKDLSLLYGKGFIRFNLFYMRKLYFCFPIRETLSHYLKMRVAPINNSILLFNIIPLYTSVFSILLSLEQSTSKPK